MGKKVKLAITGAASPLGMTAATAMPRAQKQPAPSSRVTTAPQHAADHLDPEQQHGRHHHDHRADHREPHRRADAGGDVDPRGQGACPDPLEQALVTVDGHPGDQAGVAGGDDREGQHARSQELDVADVAQLLDAAAAVEGAEQQQEHHREGEREEGRERVAEEQPVLGPDLAPEQPQVGRRPAAVTAGSGMGRLRGVGQPEVDVLQRRPGHGQRVQLLAPGQRPAGEGVEGPGGLGRAQLHPVLAQ